MPELPEVEVISRGLAPHILGNTFQKITFSHKKLRLPLPNPELRALLCGSLITKVERRAKYITIGTDNGVLLVIHLGMTGNLDIFPEKTRPAKHDHGRFLMQNQFELRYNDTRRFGSIMIFAPDDPAKTSFFGKMGPEPFTDAFSASYLCRMALNRKKPVKNFLMDNQIVVGLGNIYANEILYASSIHPQTAVNTIKTKGWQTIIDQTRTTLTKAIAAGGSTISDFVNSSGEKGYFQLSLQVYGRKGEKCPKCQGTIHKINMAGRATFFCDTCQK